MDESSKLHALSNLYSQLGPLTKRVNEIHQELLHFKRTLSGNVPISSTISGNKRTRSIYDNLPPVKRRRSSSEEGLLQLPDTLIWKILRLLDVYSLLQFSMSCKMAYFYCNETLLWFPFQHRQFRKLHCKPLALPPGAEIIPHISRRMNIQKNWKGGEYSHSLSLFQVPPHALHIDPVQSNIVLLTNKEELIEWDILSGEQVSVTRVSTACTDFCINKSHIYISTNDSISVFDRTKKSKDFEIHALLSLVNRMAVSPSYLVAGLWDGNIKLIEPQTGEISNSITGHRAPIYSLDIQKHIIVSGSSDRTIKVWNVRGDVLATLTGHSKTINSLQLTKDLSTLFSASKDHLVRSWDFQQGLCNAEFRGHTDAVHVVAWRGESLLVSGGADKTICLWDIRQPNPAHKIDIHEAEVVSLDIDEKRIVSCSSDGALVVCDFAKL